MSRMNETFLTKESPTTAKSLRPQGLAQTVADHLNAYFQAHEGDLPSGRLYDLIINEVERPLILRTMKAVNGTQSRAAEILGINRNTLRKKIKELDINTNHIKS